MLETLVKSFGEAPASYCKMTLSVLAAITQGELQSEPGK